MSDQTALTQDQLERLAELTSLVEAYERGSATAEYSPDGKLLRANQQFADLVGHAADGIVGQEHRAFVSSDVAASAEYTGLWEQLRTGSNPTGEFRLVWQDVHQDLWIRSTFLPVRNATDQVVKVVEYALDVTPASGPPPTRRARSRRSTVPRR